MLNQYQVFELPGSEPQRGFQRPNVEVHCCSSSGKETTKVGGLGTGSNSFGRTSQGHRVDSCTYGRADVKSEYNESAGSTWPAVQDHNVN